MQISLPLIKKKVQKCGPAGEFCLASQNWCDSVTRCGNPIKNVSECRTAAAELGFNSTVIEVDSKAAPLGCFQAIEDADQSQLYYNPNGKPLSDSMFVKALCWVRTTGLSPPILAFLVPNTPALPLPLPPPPSISCLRHSQIHTHLCD